MSDILASSKALLRLDAANALVPHGLGGHGRSCLTWCVEEIERLRSDLALLGPVTTPLNGKQCASCGSDCCDHWTYCPSCGAQERIKDQSVRVKR